MNSAPHRIRSLRWQIDANSTAEAFSWRALLREKGTDLLLPALEQGFDEVATGELVVHIPKIELRVRLNSEGELETILAGKILDQLREQLQRLLADDGTSLQTPAAKSTTAERSRFEILLQYLQTGTLPWQAAGTTASDQAAALSGTCRDELSRIVEHLKAAREDAPFYFRLLQLLPEEGYALLIRALSGVIPQEFRAAAMRCLVLLLNKERERFSRRTRLNLMAGILAESMAGQYNSAPRSLLRVAAAAVPLQERHLLEKFVAALPAPAAELFRPKDLDAVTGSGRFGSAPGVAVIELPDSPRQEGHRQSHPEDSIAARPRSPGVFTEEDGNPPAPAGIGRQSRSGPSAELFPMLVRQAGLVLLHPYLARFLESRGVKDVGSTELHLSDLPRAAALLHFLATGREELYEYELGLIKILLGLHPETALPVCDGLLTPDDSEEVEALLQSVINHWSALKNTSIHGIRSSFIERQGLLREEESGWKLNVERKPHDILLDRIPWSVGIVKLPWMQKAIFTEW